MSSSNYTEKTRKEDIIEYVLRILHKLSCSEIVREETMSLIERADTQGLLTTGTPKGLAAGSVYIACILCEDRKTLDTIGGVVGLSGSSVSTNYMVLARGLGFSERYCSLIAIHIPTTVIPSVSSFGSLVPPLANIQHSAIRKAIIALNMIS